MGSKETTKLLLNRMRSGGSYNSYANKRAYYDAIAAGDANAINDLSQRNYEYPSQVFSASDSYSDAMYRLYYDAVCAASEMCLVAIQNGLPDMVAYDVRDCYMIEFDRAMSLPDLYDLIHGMAHEFATRVHYAKVGSMGSSRLTSMMTYIEEHLEDRITLQAVADAAGLSRNYACRVFKEELGISMNEFIVRERVAEATRLLADNSLQISEIAEQLQFCSQSYFTQCFHKVTGKTPNEYRTSVCFLK